MGRVGGMMEKRRGSSKERGKLEGGVEGKIKSGQIMVNGTLRIMFNSGLWLLLSPPFTPLSPTQAMQQMALTSVFPLRGQRSSREEMRVEAKQNKGEIGNVKHKTTKRTGRRSVTKQPLNTANENPTSPHLVAGVCGVKLMCWQNHYNIIQLKSSAVETSWLNHDQKGKKKKSKAAIKWQLRSCGLKVTAVVWLNLTLPQPVKQRVWKTNKNRGWRRTDS